MNWNVGVEIIVLGLFVGIGYIAFRVRRVPNLRAKVWARLAAWCAANSEAALLRDHRRDMYDAVWNDRLESLEELKPWGACSCAVISQASDKPVLDDDKARIDTLERFVKDSGALVLHTGFAEVGKMSGLAFAGTNTGSRSLRTALDQIRKTADTETAKEDTE